jgi:hypothetical protein
VSGCNKRSPEEKQNYKEHVYSCLTNASEHHQTARNERSDTSEIHRKTQYKKRKSLAALQTDERRSTNTPVIAKVFRKSNKPRPRYKPTGRVTSNDVTMLRSLSRITGSQGNYHRCMLQLRKRPTKCPAMRVCGCSSKRRGEIKGWKTRMNT